MKTEKDNSEDNFKVTQGASQAKIMMIKRR